MKKKMKILFLALLLIVSLIVILYPLIANYLSEKNRSLIETQYTEAIKQMDTSALDAARAAASAYNETLLTVPDKPFTKDALIKASESYDALLNVREDGIMGYVEIPAIGVNRQLARVLRQNGIDLDHLIGQRLPQHTEKENVALFQEVEIGKHLLSGKAAVTGQYTMCSEAAHRERGAKQVSHAPVKGAFLRSVIDW